MRLLLAVAAVQLVGAIVATDGSGSVLRVPSQFADLETAFDAISAGDTVLVAPGTYTGPGNRRIHVPEGVDFTLLSEAGAEQTILDGERQELQSCLIFYEQTEATTVRGFTFTRFVLEWPEQGAAITTFTSTDPTIQDCHFIDNDSDFGGGGIFARGARIERCTFSGNRSSAQGAGVLGRAYVVDSVFRDNVAGGGAAFSGIGTIRNCLFEANQATGADIGGGAVGVYLGDATVEHCTFVGNRGGYGSDIVAWQANAIVEACTVDGAGIDWFGSVFAYDSQLQMRNCVITGRTSQEEGIIMSVESNVVLSGCTIVGNEAMNGMLLGSGSFVLENTLVAFNKGPVVKCLPAPDVQATCTDLYGNTGGDWVECLADQLGTNGNISLDPLFCDLDSGDFRLHTSSPCAPGPECDLIGALPVNCGPSSVDQETVDAPLSVVACPSPALTTATFSYVMPRIDGASEVILDISDASGRRVARLHGPVLEQGTLEWNLRDSQGRPVPAGAYFYQLVAGERRARGSVVILR